MLPYAYRTHNTDFKIKKKVKSVIRTENFCRDYMHFQSVISKINTYQEIRYINLFSIIRMWYAIIPEQHY